MMLDTMTYPELNIAAQIWREVKHISGNIARKGWRPVFCWVVCYVVLYGYIVAPQQGIKIDLNAVNTLATVGLGMFITRGVEKWRGAA